MTAPWCRRWARAQPKQLRRQINLAITFNPDYTMGSGHRRVVLPTIRTGHRYRRKPLPSSSTTGNVPMQMQAAAIAWCKVADVYFGQTPGLTYRDVIEQVWQNESAALVFAASLHRVPVRAGYFECPPLTLETADKPFECTLHSAPILGRVRASAEAFDEHLSRAPASATVIDFFNLSRTAHLVVPTARSHTNPR